MGGMKKKSMGSQDKNVATGPGGAEIKTSDKDSEKKKGKPQQKQRLSVLVEEAQGMKTLQGMKSVTIQSFARATGVKISVANAFIKSLESKGVVRSVGGYSGHRVYEVIRR